MRKFLIWLTTTTIAMALWAALAVTSTTNGWFRDSIATVGNTGAFMDAAVATIEAKYRGNIAFILIENGQIFDKFNASVGNPVDQDTVFQVASLSKWITAWGIMTLVDQGKLELDVPVSTYLTRWQLPASEFDNDAVTVRHLLSHTSGLTDELGYAGFAPGTTVQTLEESLAQPNSSSPERDHTIKLGLQPGSEWKYSGGGYTILQLLVEEVTGKSFEAYMREAVFEPLGMNHSSYEIDQRNRLNQAISYQLDGTLTTRYHWTNHAAASFYTSTADMTRFIQAHLAGPDGQSIGRGSLNIETVKQMREPQASMIGMDIWGLGAILHAANNDGDFVIGGAGLRARPAINADARLNPATGNGFVILQTGNRALASDLASEWTFWETGKRDLFLMKNAIGPMIKSIVGGWLVILIISLVLGWWIKRAHRTNTKEPGNDA